TRPSWSTRKKDRAPRGVYRHLSGVWAIRFRCGAGSTHKERVDMLLVDLGREQHARRRVEAFAIKANEAAIPSAIRPCDVFRTAEGARGASRGLFSNARERGLGSKSPIPAKTSPSPSAAWSLATSGRR